MKRICGFLLVSFWLLSCEGLTPLDDVDPTGTIAVSITYQGDWPPANQLFELRFLAFRFIPRTESDFTRITEMVISDRLQYFVDEQTIVLSNVRNGTFFYNAIGWQFGENIFADWRPVGVYTENDGIAVLRGDSIHIHILVDFDNLPVFPPEFL